MRVDKPHLDGAYLHAFPTEAQRPVYFIGKLSAGFGRPFCYKGEPVRGSCREMPARGPEQPLRSCEAAIAIGHNFSPGSSDVEQQASREQPSWHNTMEQIAKQRTRDHANPSGAAAQAQPTAACSKATYHAIPSGTAAQDQPAAAYSKATLLVRSSAGAAQSG